MKIDITSDVACPWCYVGKKNLEAAMAQRPEIEFEIRWLPYQLHPEAPAEGYDYHRTIERKFGKGKMSMMVEHFRQAGEDAGIDFHLERIERGANTLMAHRLLELARHKGIQNQLSEALFDAYFCQGRFVGDIAVLTEIAVEQGMDEQEVNDYLASDAGVNEIKQQIDMARRDGVMGVPSFNFEDKYDFQGGQPVEVFLNVIDRMQEQISSQD